ncbi:MAG: DUF427 domain-containing protein [Alphaproteobacteria bacterium]|jgi:uncharacterized protein (DUF427 family)
MSDHIKISPAHGRYRVKLGDTVIGETVAAMALVEGGGRAVIYVPRADMRMDLLQATDHHTTCPWKGLASYFSIGNAANVVWSYENPKSGCDAIAGHLAFYPAVTVEKV